jgi:hypothetical protein
MFSDIVLWVNSMGNLFESIISISPVYSLD